MQRARTYIYTTATPPLIAHALLKSLELIERDHARRAHLFDLIGAVQRGLARSRWALLPSQTAIQPLVVGSSRDAVALSEKLAERGLLVPAIRPPTVPRGHGAAAHLAFGGPSRRRRRAPHRCAAFHPGGRVKSLVLLHGWGMSPAVFRELAAKLERSHEVHALPLPGYAGSLPCEPYASNVSPGTLRLRRPSAAPSPAGRWGAGRAGVGARGAAAGRALGFAFDDAVFR